MGITKMDHVAIAVENIEESTARWMASLGVEAGPFEELPERGVRLCKLRAPGSPALELISPLGDDSPVSRFLAKNGEGIHHICFEVDNIDLALDELKSGKADLIHESPVAGAGGSRIAFIRPESFNGVLIELKQKE
jgi:methylmalonyl-CoA/ethylmalonyl-CoA epimerase